ncbi:DUF4893 domain-containing protein [Sphingomonas sp. NSE70-1]|uniref:DUF4893 domain-containing protein n=1 Tax=Sphingomonas caseinilyticus TaxID=2908205 RepID=A0ABT0RTD3_9SPHN|nr:DUF4893 domain-containing protein [Sphingomonas caseinilyticus]MCL6698253.1 DUF4893 domain-containing protein [Sphingomonas caseinilyticus]
MRILASLLLLAVTSCATTQAPSATTGWQEVVTPEDRIRLRDWRTAFTRALDQANAANHAAEIANEGALLEPDAAVGGPIPNGDYRCRVIKLGAKSQGMLEYVAYPAFRCRIDQGKMQRFTKLTGSQRHVGKIYPGDQLREVFLGTLVLGDETRAYQYGRDRDRDVAGWVERIGDNRWRMVLPYPNYESLLDVIELVPEQ